MIQSTRYQSDTYCTLSKLELPCGYSCHILELPWRGNQVGESCIPAGTYKLRLRRSPIVERTSGGEFKHGFELSNVPGRTYIMIHPGNWPSNTEGCLLPGRKPQDVGGALGVPASRAVFRESMQRLLSMAPADRVIDIVWSLDEFPRHET